jgi:hypothetical protein
MYNFIQKGIYFGNEKAKNWLISIAISLFFGIFLLQPLQVNKIVLNSN